MRSRCQPSFSATENIQAITELTAVHQNSRLSMPMTARQHYSKKEFTQIEGSKHSSQHPPLTLPHHLLNKTQFSQKMVNNLAILKASKSYSC